MKKQALLLEEVHKLNRENADRSISPKRSEAEEPLILDEEKAPEVEHEELFPHIRESLTELKEEEEKVDKDKAEDIEDEADEVVTTSEEEIKEVLEDDRTEEDCAMFDVKNDKNFETPQRYRV